MSLPNHKKIQLNYLALILLLAKSMVLGGCLFLLYTLFGDNIDWNPPKNVAQTERSNNPVYSSSDDDWDKVENGVHVSTGLIYATNFDLVRANCTTCHSGKLIAQNRATREGWQQMIRWMQKTQGLWDLGSNEPRILDYLETNYAPQEVGRRANIDVAAVKWYILELE